MESMIQMRQEEFETILKEAIETRCKMEAGKLNGMLNPAFEECDAVNGTAKISFAVEEWQLNPRSELHGGITAAMFDTGMGLVAYATAAKRGLNKGTTTTDLAVSYIRPILPGDRLVIHVTVNNAGRRLIRTTGEARSAGTGKIIATSTCTYMPLG